MQQIQLRPKELIRNAFALGQRWLAHSSGDSSRFSAVNERRFVILGIGRTGSGFLCRMLDRQNDIVCASELFNHLEPFFLNTRIQKFVAMSKEERDNDPREFIRRFWSFETAGACLGFKMFFNHDAQILDDLVSDPSVKKIVLDRRNKVKRFVSWSVARETRRWTKLDSTPIQQARVKIAPEILLKNVRKYDRIYEDVRLRLATSNQKYLEIYYEDLVGDEKIDCLTDAAEYLGCRNIDKSLWRTDVIFKQNSDNLAEIIENYEELKLGLSGTELEQFLD